MRGRKPKPTALKVLEGNPGKRELNEFEPQMPSVDIDIRPPKFLLPEAKREWKRLAPTLVRIGILTLADVSSFAAYCQAYARYVQAEEAITKVGMAYLHKDSGQLKASPYVAIANKYLAEMKSFAAEFGLTPSTRTLMISGNEGSNKDIDPMEQLLTTTFADDVDTGITSNFQ